MPSIGLGLGWLGARMLRSVALPSSGLYPIAVLAFCALAYGAADVLHTSGFLAVYLAALVLGNADLPHRPTVRGFAEGLGWIAQIGLFVLLGLLVSPSDLLEQVVPALVIGTVLLLLARPLSVLASVSWLGYSWRDQAFLSWAGLRGAVPIVLATVPVQLGVPGTEGLFELVFVLVVVFTLVQAPTLPRVARRLRLRRRHPAGPGGGELARSARSTPRCSPSGSGPGRSCTAWSCSSCGCRRAPASRSSSATGPRSCPRRAPGCAAATS